MPDRCWTTDGSREKVGLTINPRNEVRLQVIDPAALGTLIIGTQANRHDDERAAFDRAHAIRPRQRLAMLRIRAAATLRSVAARLEPTTAS
jgi:hypothetical protein